MLVASSASFPLERKTSAVLCCAVLCCAVLCCEFWHEERIYVKGKIKRSIVTTVNQIKFHNNIVPQNRILCGIFCFTTPAPEVAGVTTLVDQSMYA